MKHIQSLLFWIGLQGLIVSGILSGLHALETPGS